MTESESIIESRREFERTGLRTPVTAVVKNKDGTLSAIKAWSDDISPAGACILCHEAIESSVVFLRVATPGLQDKLLCGHIVRRSTAEQWFNKRAITRHVYGVMFSDICEDPQIKACAGLAG